ncbi:immunoglobulin-like domain-containing protein [Listeria aquatica]|uniref:immunoglobulin-like domain-containing protein n=1 Tax=Listeria aquatica TaxID=1494960 RepID=UPI003F71E50E
MPIGTITADQFTIGQSSYVTGDYTGDTTKIMIEINGEKKQSITVPADGNYKYYIRGLQAADEKIFMVAYDLSGKELDRVELPLSVTK